MLGPLIIVTGAFSLLGGSTAFAIIYLEYQRHQLGQRRVLAESLQAGILAFVVLMVMGLAAGLLVGRISK